MRKCFRAFFILLAAAGSLCPSAVAAPQFNAASATSSPPPQNDTGQRNDAGKPQQPDCTKPDADARCRPPQPPHFHPAPYRPRPVIINQLPPQPAIEINTLSDDWEGCRKAKLGAMRARDAGRIDEANNLDDWLWKNCRSYSNELRQLEQDDM